jgi:hypothetical protein
VQRWPSAHVEHKREVRTPQLLCEEQIMHQFKHSIYECPVPKVDVEQAASAPLARGVVRRCSIAIEHKLTQSDHPAALQETKKFRTSCRYHYNY